MLRSRLLPLLLLLAGTACTACSTDPEPLGEPVALANAETRWREQRLTSYILLQARSCFCPDGGVEHVMTVENGQITSVRSQQTGEQLPTTRYAHFRTVEQLFNEARNAFNKPGVLREVRFDPLRGYPTLLSLDPVPNAVDDETGYSTALVFNR